MRSSKHLRALPLFIGLLLLSVLAGLLAACGTSRRPLDGPGITPRPLDVLVTLDASRAVSRTIPTEGGTLQATASDGTAYVLTVPPDSLIADTEITMTPITGIQGAPIEGAAPLGVQLQPDGLRLHLPATLRVTPANGSEGVEAMSFTYQGDGEAFHGYPLALDPASLEFNLLHFSGYLVYLGPAVESSSDYQEFMPSDWEGQLEHLAQELIRTERDAQLRGEQGDPQFSQKLEAIMNSYYQNVIAPLLPLIASDCEAAREHSAEVIAWTRQTHLFGLANSFQAQNDAIWESVRAGLDNCWEETIEPCLDQSDAAQIAEAVSIARQLQLLGASPTQYDPFDPALQCDAIWSGTITYTETGSITRYPEAHQTETTGSWTHSYQHQQTIEIGSLVSESANGGAELSVALNATGQLSEHGHYRKEHYDDCIASADDILRYVFDDSTDADLVGEIHEQDTLIVSIGEDSSYEIFVPVLGFLNTGTRTTRHYSIDNCWPDSESEEVVTEQAELYIDDNSVTLSGTLQPDNPNHLSGSYSQQRVQDPGGVPTTVTVTWDLTRQAR